MKPIASVFTPAYPAVLLLYGMLFAFAVTHFTSIPWSPSITIAVYTTALVWVSALAWWSRRNLGHITTIDMLFIGFVLVVSASLVFQGGLQAGGWEYARFMPFMMIAPYLCGRLMRMRDLDLFSRIVMYAGVGILPLLLLDRMVSTDMMEGPRWTFFGRNHSPLLVGALLAAALLALFVRAADSCNSGGGGRRLLHYGLIGTLSGFLVWVSARGWLIASIAGLVVLVLSTYRDSRLRGAYSRQLAFVVAVMLLSLAVLPRADQFYLGLLTDPSQVAGPPQVAGLILGEESCQPFKEGVNSVAMRWVLYREAVAMFVQFPVLGVGAARFGERSCTGAGWYPHSTVLQAFSELGLIGGCMLLGLLLLAAFKLARRGMLGRHHLGESPVLFAVALSVAFFVSDQFYGTYFMSTGVNFMLGLVSGMPTNNKQERIAHV